MKTTLVFTAFAILYTANAQVPSSFTYQGRLLDGAAPVQGRYDFRFDLYNHPTTGGPPVANAVTATGVSVSNGVFQVELGFASNIFNGTPYWLEIAVRPTGGSSFVRVLPRQPITATPYAMFANRVANGAIGSAKSAPGSVSALHIVDGSVSAAKLAVGAVGTQALADGAVSLEKLQVITDFGQALPPSRTFEALSAACRNPGTRILSNPGV